MASRGDLQLARMILRASTLFLASLHLGSWTEPTPLGYLA
jgi:hypothetical protein